MNRNSPYTVFLILISAGIIATAMNFSAAFRSRKDMLMKILYPASCAVEYPVKKTRSIYNRAGLMFDCYDRNMKLTEENELLKQRYDQFSELEKENEKLREILSMPERPGYSIVPVETVSISAENYFNEINVSAGLKDGVKEDSPVVIRRDSEWFILGRVEEVFDSFSRVIVLTSPFFRCAAELPSGAGGVLKGDNRWELKLEYISPEAAIEIGDRVITSGRGGIFPGGLTAGYVTEISKSEYTSGKSATVLAYLYPQDTGVMYILIVK